jgi:hypothetical protein
VRLVGPTWPRRLRGGCRRRRGTRGWTRFRTGGPVRSGGGIARALIVRSGGASDSACCYTCPREVGHPTRHGVGRVCEPRPVTGVVPLWPRPPIPAPSDPPSRGGSARWPRRRSRSRRSRMSVSPHGGRWSRRVRGRAGVGSASSDRSSNGCSGWSGADVDGVGEVADQPDTHSTEAPTCQVRPPGAQLTELRTGHTPGSPANNSPRAAASSGPAREPARDDRGPV